MAIWNWLNAKNHLGETGWIVAGQWVLIVVVLGMTVAVALGMKANL